jgi:hypothetical protein
MLNRIVVSDTDNPRSKLFAFSKKLASYYNGTYRKNGDKVELTWSNKGTPTLHTDWTGNNKAAGELAFRLLDYSVITEVEVIAGVQVRVTLSPAYFWSDLHDGIAIYDHVIEIIVQMLFNNVEPEIVVEGPTNPNITVFTGADTSNHFVLNRPIVPNGGEILVTKDTHGDVRITKDSLCDDHAIQIGRAILLHPNLTSVHFRGQCARIDAGAYSGEQHHSVGVTADARVYALTVIRSAVYPNERVTVHYSNAAEQPTTALNSGKVR